MTRKDVRMLYKTTTGVLPNGSMKSLSDELINANFDTELSAYIKWLEDLVIKKQEQFEQMTKKAK